MARRPARLRLTALLAPALAAGLLAALPPVATADHTPAPGQVVLAGSMQSELGCSGDWQPDCAATALAPAGGTVFSGTFEMPAGSHELKVAVGGSWDESYGAGGAADGANIPLVLKGAASVEVVYDHATHLVAFRPTELSGPRERADADRPGVPCASRSPRSASTS
jgi:hypothetical protein